MQNPGNQITPVEKNELEIIPSSQMDGATRAEIDIQISTAKRYPRSLEKFRQDALSMATADKEVAASCFYKLKRGKGQDAKIIEGPSVRLAEIVANAWGNLRFGARTVHEGQKEVVAQGVAHDLEKNVCNTIEVSRRITTSTGQRYGDDMIGVTKNAACSIALRNAIFKTVPFTYVKTIYEHAKKVAVGDSKTLLERRQAMLDAFSKMGVSKEQIITFLEVPSIEDIGLSEVELMIGTFTAIKDGDTTIDQQFPMKSTKPTVQGPRSTDAAPANGQPAKEIAGGEEKIKPSDLDELNGMAKIAGISWQTVTQEIKRWDPNIRDLMEVPASFKSRIAEFISRQSKVKNA